MRRSKRLDRSKTTYRPTEIGLWGRLRPTLLHRACKTRVALACVARHLLRDRPGATRVVLHLPAPSGHETLPMELRRGVAYDAELLAEVGRRLGDGIVELHLA